jgi:uncharacterized protein DUF6186
VSGSTASVAGFLALLVAALTLEVTGRRRPDRVTAAQALAAAMRTTPGRAAVLVAWLWLGVHFLAR